MDHTIIDESHIAERFVQGKLAPEEARLFEEHFLGCAECLERVELAERLQEGLRRAAGRRAAAAAVVVGAGLLAGWSRRARIAAFALALLLAAGLPVALLLPRIARLDRALGDARADLTAARRSTAERQAAARTAEENRGAERQEAARLAAELERARQPQVNVPILALSLLRSGGAGAAGEPAARFRFPSTAAPWAVVSLEPSDPGFPVYRVTLRSGGRVLWQGGGLTATPAGLLSFSLPRALLAPGGFTLDVEGLPAGGAPVPAGTFPFRVVP